MKGRFFMLLRRWMLLIFGILGGILAATGLYISAESILTEEVRPTFAIEPTEVTQPKVQRPLPLGVPGTAMIAQRLSAYDGPFLEDGSDREVLGIAALLVYNGGSREILSAQITLEFAETVYHFSGENIPAGGMVVLLEQDAKPYRNDTPISCAGWQILSQTEPVSAEQLAVTDGEMGMLTVRNLTDSTLKNICIYYKSWLSPPDIYVGGISYCVSIPQLLPGQTVYVYPSHYATGYSKVASATAGSA